MALNTGAIGPKQSTKECARGLDTTSEIFSIFVHYFCIGLCRNTSKQVSFTKHHKSSTSVNLLIKEIRHDLLGSVGFDHDRLEIIFDTLS